VIVSLKQFILARFSLATETDTPLPFSDQTTSSILLYP
jgi:hypothetical protein